MAQIIPIYIPVYVASETYQPARVLPRLLFFNGLLECEQYYIKDGDNSSRAQTAFPYFDNYNVVSGSFPTDGSKSLLFQNENPSYGAIPTASLYTEYWENYINLLYNPVTRLLNASAIIPLKDYFEMDLNDVVNFRGNYYHLRAINDYSLKTGDCTIQLLGPIIPNSLTDTINPTTTTTTSTTSTSTTSTTSTTTTTAPPGCFEYEYGPAATGCTINWTNCGGSAGSAYVAYGDYYSIPCMIEGTGTGCGPFVKGAPC